MTVTLDAATTAAKWIFLEGRDFEARHGFYTYELGREWPDGATWSHAFAVVSPKALALARSSYRLFIAETSKDALKSFNDLRKALNEEITKAAQLTRDLLSGLWRDFAVGLAAILGREALSTAATPASAHIVPILLWGTAAYLGLSLITTLWSNYSFLENARTSRATWKNRIYSFVDDDDFTELVTSPVNKAVHNYYWSQIPVIAAYVGIIAFLIVQALGTPAEHGRSSQQHQAQRGHKTPVHGAAQAGIDREHAVVHAGVPNSSQGSSR